MLLAWGNGMPDTQDDASERKIIHQLIDRRVDGVILRPSCEAFERSYFEEIWEREIPLILVDREMSKVSTDFVGTDDEAGGRAAAQHLIELGHRHLLFIGSSELVSTSRHREKGFRDLLSETPNAYGRSLNLDAAGFDEQLDQLLKQDDRPTAIFCYCDPVAERVATGLLERGLNIPGDISLIGFGHQASGHCPILITTFDQHPALIGKTAADLDLQRVEEGLADSTRQERIPADLVIRNSTAPLTSA